MLLRESTELISTQTTKIVRDRKGVLSSRKLDARVRVLRVFCPALIYDTDVVLKGAYCTNLCVNKY